MFVDALTSRIILSNEWATMMLIEELLM